MRKPDQNADVLAPAPVGMPSEDALFAGSLRLLQPRSGHRAGTDAVLLAAATPVDARAIVDLGAASGIVGLRAAQINPAAAVTLIEREPELVDLANRNIRLNALEGQVSARLLDVLTLGRDAGMRERFDCVLTNPPFFDRGTIRVSGNENRARAHVLEGTLDDWLRKAVAILAPAGELVMIHRADALGDILGAAAKRLGDLRLRFVHPTAEAPAIRVLVAARKGSRAPLTILPPLVLNGADGRFLPEAAALHAGRARLPMRQVGGKVESGNITE
jgi:tRNA1(Val) A37 N6-methylase TrmN6